MDRTKATNQEVSRISRRDTKALDITSDPETLGVVFEGIRLLSAGISLIFVAYTLYNLTRLEVPGVKTVILVDQCELVITGLIFWISQTRRVHESWVHVLSATLAVSVAIDTAISIRIYGEPSDLQYMIAVVLGGAATVVSVRWLVFVLIGTISVATWAALEVCNHNQLIDFIVSQVGATILSVIIFVGRVRGFRTVARFRMRDAQKTFELKLALERAEREFQEHETAEKQNIALIEQLRQSQKLEALGTLAGGIAHDINNVIGAITAIASTTVRDLASGAPGRKELKQILVAARRGTTLTRNLVRFARQEPPKNAPFSIDEVVTEVEALLLRTFDKRISITTSRGCTGWSVLGDSGLISHALMNLCLNASDAISDHGEISITTRKTFLEASEAQPLGIVAGDYVELLVGDDGSGMTQAVLDRAFEPFFTTKEDKRRSGLGLPMVYGTIQQHQGGLKIESQPGQGTKIRILLPAFEQPVALLERKRSKFPSVDSLRPLVLFVDDEPLLRKAGKRMLKSLGYDAIIASDGREALEKFKESRNRIGAVVLDVAMPIMNGVECCQELRRIDPKIPVILASGFTKGHDLQSQLATPNTRYMRKPYELDDLAENLAELAETFRDFARMSCQVHCVRISTPSQKNAASLSPEAMNPSTKAVKKSGETG